MALFPNGYKHITVSGRNSAINHLGQLKLDQLRARPYTSFDLLAGIHPSTGCNPSTFPGEGCPQSFPLRVSYSDYDGSVSQYTIEWNVSDDAEPRSNMKTVTVTVGYGLYSETGTTQLPTNQVYEQRVAKFKTYITQ
jgi:hypothetical protein